MIIRSTDDVDLLVHDLGGPTGSSVPSILFVHATGFHGPVWAPLAARLERFHRWSVDMRAHGGSTTPTDRPLEWDGFADDVLNVIDALGLDQPIGVGHSKGGAALLLAEQRRPGTFRALWLYEPVVMPSQYAIGVNEDNPLSNGARRRRANFADHEEALTNYASKPPFDALHPDALRAYVTHGFGPSPDGGVTLRCRPEDEAAVYAHGSAHQAFRHLGEVDCPVTIALGVEDSVPAVFGRSIAAELPRGQVQSHPHLGHFGPLEDPHGMARAIEEALEPVIVD